MHLKPYKLKGYQKLVKKPRQKKENGGGVIIYIKEGLKIIEKQIPTLDNIEICAVTVYGGKDTIDVCCIYTHTCVCQTVVTNTKENFDKLLKAQHWIQKSLIGDFNTQHPAWNLLGEWVGATADVAASQKNH